MAITKWNLEEELTSARMNQMADEIDNGLDEHKADLAKYARFTKSSNQSLANGVDTQIQWDTKTPYNGEDFCVIDSATKQIKITKTGFYQLQITIVFSGEAGGVRVYWGSILNNVYPTTDTPCYMSLSETIYASAGTLINTRVSQVSGNSLDVLSSGTSLVIRKVG